MKKVENIDEYIEEAPKESQAKLRELRAMIKEVAPNASEAISYGLATFKLNGNLVHFGGFGDHIGFYPTPSAIEAFMKELSPYKLAKGTISFPLDKPLPKDLIVRIVKFRLEQNLNKK
jgi:uncharacterized protein YdhG (YjbR/CyaY superfamily)